MDEAHLARLVALADTAQVVRSMTPSAALPWRWRRGGLRQRVLPVVRGARRAVLYLDRVVIAESFRRQGLASLLYDAMEERATQFGRMCCEVNVDPQPCVTRLPCGARYHELARYRSSPTKEVVLLEKPLSESAAAPR